MDEAEYFTRDYREEEDMRDEMYAKTMPLSEYEAMKKRIADLEAQLERQTNRALKWRRQAAYYKLRELRCMGEANYTSVERVDELEAQRDDLAAALHPLAEAWHGQPISDGNILMRDVIDVAAADIKRAADALARLEGEAVRDDKGSA